MIKWVISPARITRQDRTNLSGEVVGEEWWVQHPNNDAILAYCETESEARMAVEALAAATRMHRLNGPGDPK